MQERYRDQVKCVYIDPPYNTGNDGFAYKDNYQHSSWATMLSDRVVAQMPLTDLSCIFFASTDDNEGSIMRLCLDRLLSRDAFEAQIIVQSNKRGQTYKSISKTHEYLLTYALGASAQLGELTKAEGASAGEDRLGKYELWELRNRNPKFGRFNRSNLYYPLYVLRSRANESGFAEVSLDRRSADDIEIFPRNSKGEDSCWRWGKDTLQSVLSSLGTSGVVAKRKRDDAWGIYEKARKETTKPKSIWTETEFINEQGTIQVGQLGFKDFGFPKPVKLIEHCIALGCTNKGVILDYFTGSGTTGHAVINLNREDSGKRKYLLVEMGQYFDTVLVPRLKKVVHSTDWKDGKPQNRNSGISHGLKIVRLEGYEDALNNLRLKRTPEQEAALNNAPEKARDQYLLGYFLDVESAGSASLLDLDQFCDPFSYSLKIATASAAETKETTIDLVETFNWLLGLKVRHIDARKGFLTVIGEKRAGSRTLVIWRTLGSDPLVDNAVLEKFLGKIGVKPEDTEFDYIYVNGSHTLTDPHNKVHLIEEAFQRLMFDTPDFGMEA
jgi:adenine-specific DNA-methyltransferase